MFGRAAIRLALAHILAITFLPSVAYDPEGFQKLDRLQKNYKISWNDLPPQ